MEPEKREITISSQTKQKVESAKLFIERRYSKLIQQEKDKKQSWELLYKKMQLLNLSELEQERVRKNILHKEAEGLRLARKKISIRDYDLIKIVGRGAFGEVRLCRQKATGEPVAIKKMKKSLMIHKNKVIQAREQKDILANSENNPWIVDLRCSFQDDRNLYLVMEYLPGGDLMNLLMKKDIFTEDESRFYIAEILLALDSVHELHYIHRDLKPDNILIDANGHIKLSDFGLCKHTQIRPKKLTEAVQKKDDDVWKKKPEAQSNNPKEYHRIKRKLAYSAVGTPDYVAPEVQGKGGYTETVDWWSMGVILFEMLVGYPPFVSEEPSETWHKILNWKKYFSIPKDANVSPAAADLIKQLVNDQRERLGFHGVEEIKQHPFFTGVDWKKIREKKAPYVPELKNSFDTRNFDPFEEQESWEEDRKHRGSRKDVMFIGYTFKKSDPGQSQLLKALLDLDSGNLPEDPDERNTICDSLQLDKPKLELTDDQRKRIFKKDKEEPTTRQPKQIYSLTATKLYSNRAPKKSNEHERYQQPKQPIKNNFVAGQTITRSKQRSVKQSPSQFSKQKQEAIRKMLAKGSLRPTPISLTSAKR